MTRKILVVDDTRNVQVLLSDFLASQDFEVLAAYDGVRRWKLLHKSDQT